MRVRAPPRAHSHARYRTHRKWVYNLTADNEKGHCCCGGGSENAMETASTEGVSDF